MDNIIPAINPIIINIFSFLFLFFKKMILLGINKNKYVTIVATAKYVPTPSSSSTIKAYVSKKENNDQ